MNESAKTSESAKAALSALRDYFHSTAENYTLNSDFPGNFEKTDSFGNDLDLQVFCGYDAASRMTVWPEEDRIPLKLELQREWAECWAAFAHEYMKDHLEEKVDPGDGADYGKACAIFSEEAERRGDEADSFREEFWEFEQGWLDAAKLEVMWRFECETRENDAVFKISYNLNADAFPGTSDHLLYSFPVSCAELLELAEKSEKDPRAYDRFAETIYDRMEALAEDYDEKVRARNTRRAEDAPEREEGWKRPQMRW